jgi:HEPN domain-containing protein
MAERNISIGGYDVAAFLAHRAVEKLLQSIYAALGHDIPKTHYIDEIATDLGIGGETLSQIKDLTQTIWSRSIQT